MNKKVVGLAGALALSSLAANAGQAAAAAPSEPVSRSGAYADLLKPISTAQEKLKEADAANRTQTARVAWYSDDADWHRRHRRHHHHNHDRRG